MNIEQKLSVYYKENVMYNLIQCETDLMAFMNIAKYEMRGELQEKIHAILVSMEGLKNEMERIDK